MAVTSTAKTWVEGIMRLNLAPIGLRSAVVLTLLLAATPAGANAAERGVEVRQAVVRATFGHAPTTAAYMTLTNLGDAPDRLLSASCDCASQVEAHLSQQNGGMMSMAPAGPVPIPPHGVVTFRPGGLHLMLTGLKTRLVPGGRQPITLVFERAGRIQVMFEIKAEILGAGPAMAMP